MIGYRAPAATTSSIYVCNLPPGTDETLLAEHFGTIGVIKKDKRTSRFKIWIYRDKTTNEPKGDATVTYEDPHAAKAAVEWFDNKDFHGNLIRVSIAESKMKDSIEQQPVVEGGNDVESVPGEEGAPTDEVGGAGGFGAGRGRGRGELGGKAWQQEGDWPCPNPSCGNINFAFRGSCNRCSASRPSSGAGGGGGGRGRGRAGDSSGRGGARAGGLFGPNDWNCPMCGNTNWAKRTKCNICNTTKPGHTEGGIREGRAGGYKEFDEAEIEETKRRRKELEEDDGEMYDEFGNLKKKFRLKAKQGETTTQGNLGSLGWDKEELGFVENDKRKSRNSRDDHHNGYRKSDDEYRSRSVEREKGRDTEKGRDREREKGRERDRDRERARSKERDYRDRDRERDRDRRAR